MVPPWPRHPHDRRRWPELMPLWRSRARMQRRMFVWFGVSILVTGFVVSLVINTVERVRGGTGRTEWHGVEQLLSAQAARVWSNPPERDAWASDLSNHLGWGVSLEDSDGRVLAHFGPTGGRWTETVPVLQEGHPVGRVKIQAWGPTHGGWMVLLAVAVALAVLWAASGRIARRLAWPLEELTRVARDLGDGKLQSRFDVRHARGEVRSLAEVMNAMAARIERQLKDQRELLAAVSHELRTPLARIRLLLELGRNGDLQVLDPLEHEVLEMDALVGELLASARLDFSAMARVPLEANDLATRALERAALSPELLARKDGPLPLEGDPKGHGRTELCRNQLERLWPGHGGRSGQVVVCAPQRGLGEHAQPGLGHVAMVDQGHAAGLGDTGPGARFADLARRAEQRRGEDRGPNRGVRHAGRGRELIDAVVSSLIDPQ